VRAGGRAVPKHVSQESNSRSISIALALSVFLPSLISCVHTHARMHTVHAYARTKHEEVVSGVAGAQGVLEQHVNHIQAGLLECMLGLSV
jgi:hypothetical protein